jgi:hypothetical protein
MFEQYDVRTDIPVVCNFSYHEIYHFFLMEELKNINSVHNIIYTVAFQHPKLIRTNENFKLWFYTP